MIISSINVSIVVLSNVKHRQRQHDHLSRDETALR
jgi:hypothetical protein